MRFGNFVFFEHQAKLAEQKAPQGEVGYSESLLYSRSNWPKYNPDALMGIQGAKIYKKMMTDEQVKAVVRFKRDAVTGRSWYFEYDKEDLEDAKRTADQSGNGRDSGIANGDGDRQRYSLRAKFDDSGMVERIPRDVETPDNDDDALEDMESGREEGLSDEQQLRIRVFEQICYQIEGSFIDALNGIETAKYNGFSMSEKVFKDIEVGGKTWIGLAAIKLKPFDTFSFDVDEFGNIESVKQTWEGREQTIDDWRKRFIHHVQNPDVDPHYGQSELREAYRAWFSKDMVTRFWNMFLERMASGFVWITPKEGHTITAGTQEYNNLITAISTISTKTALLLPSNVELHIEMPKSTDAYENAIASHDKSIAKALLVPNLLGISEQGNTGSYSQSQTQLEAFLWTLESESRRLEETLNEQVFRQLGELNFGAGPYPRFRFKPLSDALKIQIIRLWKEMVQAKAVTATESDETHVRELLDFPEKGEPLSNTAINPITGLPMNAGGAPYAQQDEETDETRGNPFASKKAPVGRGDRGNGAGFQAKASSLSHSLRALFVERAVKRVDFAVIDNAGAKITGNAASRLTDALKEGVEYFKQFVKENDLLKNPDLVQEVELPTRITTRLRKIAESALKEAWGVGGQHARRELEKARGARFAADELRLRDEAAQKFLEARSATIAADLSDNARRKTTNIMFNGIKGGWTIQEIIDRIEDELGATVLPSAATAIRTTVFEAINEARYDFFTSPEMDGFVEALEFSAILDGKTTEICEHMDGRVYPKNDPIWEAYTPPLHFNCRSLLIAVTVRDTWTRSTNPRQNPADGFGGA